MVVVIIQNVTLPHGINQLAKLYQMTRNEKIVKLLYFKGELDDRRMKLDFLEEQDMNVDFKIIVSVIKC